MAHLGTRYSERGQLKVYNRTVANHFSLPQAEGSVLLFVLQRTAAWGNVWESISLREFEKGVLRRKNGQRNVIVRGTGLSSNETAKAIRVLREMGAIEVHDFGQKTIYRIVPEWCHHDFAESAYKIWEVTESDYIYECSSDDKD